MPPRASLACVPALVFASVLLLSLSLSAAAQSDASLHTHRVQLNETESVYVLPGAVPGIALCFAGYRFIGTAIFLIATALGTALFFTAGPNLFPDTPFCCGHNGTWTGLIVVSLTVGLLMGLLARWLLRVGIFLVGATLGLGVAILLMATPLQDVKTFKSDLGVLLLYIGCMLLFGILSVTFLRKLFLVFTTALGGSLLFILGVDYFVRSNFDAAILYALRRFKWSVQETMDDHKATVRFNRSYDRNTYILLAAFLVLALLGMIVQLQWGERGTPVQQKIVMVKSKRQRMGSVNDDDRAWPTERDPLLR